MNGTFITITGMQYYFGKEVFRVDQIVVLEKERDNENDDEAIRVCSDAGVTYGYVANSIYTVARGTMSAGRIYDLFKQTTHAKILFITRESIIAQVLVGE